MRQHEGNAKHGHINESRDTSKKASISNETSEILLPGGVKSQSTLLFRGDTNSNNLPDFERDTLQKDSISEKKILQMGDLSCSTSKEAFGHRQYALKRSKQAKLFVSSIL